jgi:allantoin racemase
MRILNIRPIVSEVRNASTIALLNSYSTPGYEYEISNVKYGGVTSIEGMYFIAVTVPYIVERMIWAEKQGYDAVTSMCFGDPGVKEGREMVRIPVVGAGQASFHTALLCGDRIGIVTVGGLYRTRQHGALLNEIRRVTRAYGISDRVASYRTTGKPVEHCDDESMFQALRRECAAALEDGADVLILGCTGLLGVAERLQAELDVPVIDPTVAAVKVAELLLSQRLTHSKLATPAPSDVGAGCTMKWPTSLGPPDAS